MVEERVHLAKVKARQRAKRHLSSTGDPILQAMSSFLWSLACRRCAAAQLSGGNTALTAGGTARESAAGGQVCSQKRPSELAGLLRRLKALRKMPQASPLLTAAQLSKNFKLQRDTITNFSNVEARHCVLPPHLFVRHRST